MTSFKVYFLGRDTVPEFFELGRGEELSVLLVALPGVSAELRLRVSLNGEGARFSLNGVGVSPSDERIDVSVELRHNVPGCTSSQLFKNLVGGTARADFYGRIVVARDAQKTEAYQANHNLLLSETARANTRPQLEIYADDVKCSHGATVGRLNEEEQFYMRSRGISLKEARILQMISFVSPVFDIVPDPDERERLRSGVEDAIRERI